MHKDLSCGRGVDAFPHTGRLKGFEQIKTHANELAERVVVLSQLLSLMV